MPRKTNTTGGGATGSKGPKGPKGPKGRRGHHDGSIYQRESDGRWVAALTLPSGTRKYYYGQTRGEARDHLLRAQAEVERGLPLVAGQQTVQHYLTEWLETKRTAVDPASYRRYRQMVTRHLIPALGGVRLRDLTAQQIERCYADLLRGGLAARTVRGGAHVVLHSALADAVRRDLLARNVSDLVTLPRVQSRPIHPLSAEQTRAFLAGSTDDRLAGLYVLALYTGMRISELLGLRWADVTLDGPHPQARVQWQLKREPHAGWYFAPPKTRQGRRQIRLAAPAVAALRRERVRQAEERLQAGRAWHDLDLVFCSPAGEPLHARVVWRLFQRTLTRLAMPPIRFHDLRHTCATLLLAGRVNPKVVSELLGHTSVAFTLDTYAHVLPDMQQDAAAAMDRLVAVAVRALAEAVTDDYERTGEGGSQHD